MILNILPFGITRALVLDYISRKPKDEMIPKILQDLEKELKPEGGRRKIIHELCDAGVITGKLCELPMLPEAQ